MKSGLGRSKKRNIAGRKEFAYKKTSGYLFMISSIILTHFHSSSFQFFSQLINMGFSSSVDTIYGTSRQFSESLCQAGMEIEKVRILSSKDFHLSINMKIFHHVWKLCSFYFFFFITRVVMEGVIQYKHYVKIFQTLEWEITFFNSSSK